ncbi:MAG TPA: tyrosine-type recombinase/integrase [Caldilineaceae bacterium]|mgnify:CR=1 FL=1|nr:tyrosine-type recombinase/integrase [Caldilineaceae bacterium]
MKLSQLVEGFFLDKELTISSNTAATYGYYFNSVIDFLSNKEVSSITAADVKRYLIYVVKDKGLTKRTAYDRHTALSSLYSWAHAELGIDNIMRKVQKPTYTKRVIEPFTGEELQKLIKNLNKSNYRFNAVLLTLLDSGLRISELSNLTIADYTRDTGKLFIRSGKGDKDRIVYLGKKSRKAIWRYLADRPNAKPSEPLFASSNLTPLSRHNIRRDLKKYGDSLGIKCNPHKCRHTFAVNFLRNGGNIRQLQVILGHSRLDMIQTYTKLAEIDLQQATNFSPVDNL